MLKSLLEDKGADAGMFNDAIKKTSLKKLTMVEKPQKKDADGCFFWATFKVESAVELKTLGEGIQELNKLIDYNKLNDCDEEVSGASFDFEGTNKVKVWFLSACDCK